MSCHWLFVKGQGADPIQSNMGLMSNDKRSSLASHGTNWLTSILKLQTFC